MAFVILSAGTLTRSRLHTLSARTFVGVVVAIMLMMLAGGFALGYAINVTSAVPVAAPPVPAETDDRLLIDRFGELSGRIVQLHAEAAALTERLGVIGKFDAHRAADVGETKPGRLAKTPVGSPSGGPLLAPDLRRDWSLGQLGLQHRVPAWAETGLVPGRLDGEVAKMEKDLERLGETFDRLDRLATDYSLAQMSFPGRAPVAETDISSGFGNRVDPFRNRLAFHSGVDYPAPVGTPITASAGGRVIFAGRRPEYGLTVEIDHGAGLATRYAHASKLHVTVGQVVLPGQKLAEVGTTGRSTGPHLHFEVLSDGMVVDPGTYLARF